METWNADEVDWVEIPGFSAYLSVRIRSTGGGVTVAVDSALESNLSSDLWNNNGIHEKIGVEKIKLINL